MRVHLQRLVELEYLAVRYDRLGSPFQYELLIDESQAENVSHIGLIDIGRLREIHPYDSGVAGKTGQVAGGGENGSAIPGEPDAQPLALGVAG